ncbi:MAG: beta-ketoacyl-ACP synthase II [Spirochaetales bacterium]|nr:beta-ketoacyl-ACP synthase II [Spirochaetales bacterium]
MNRRVVVTGMGTVNPLAQDVAGSWEKVKNAENGISKIDLFDTSPYESKVAGIIRDLTIDGYLDPKEARRLDRFTILALIASMQAMKQAGLKNGDIDPLRLAALIGTGIGGLSTLTTAFHTLHTRGGARLHPLSVPTLLCNIASAQVAIHFNAQGPSHPAVTACAAGTDAIGMALELIRDNVVDVAIAGGSEAPLVEIAIAGFCALQALSKKFNDTPEKASRPFDKDRDGFVIAEGSGVLVLEELEHAKKRGAEIFAEVAGYGQSCDAYHVVAPEPSGRGAIQAMKTALADAGLKPEDIDYVNAHGTSTPLNDPMETTAIKAAFGGHARRFKVSSTKSMTGHMIGGTGAFEAIVSILAIRDQFFPATRNYETPDPDCDLDYVPNKGYGGRIRAAMSNSLGFGGHNGVLIFKEYRP